MYSLEVLSEEVLSVGECRGGNKHLKYNKKNFEKKILMSKNDGHQINNQIEHLNWIQEWNAHEETEGATNIRN